jgi:hypothetical protein
MAGQARVATDSNVLTVMLRNVVFSLAVLHQTKPVSDRKLKFFVGEKFLIFFSSDLCLSIPGFFFFTRFF